MQHQTGVTVRFSRRELDGLHRLLAPLLLAPYFPSFRLEIFVVTRQQRFRTLRCQGTRALLLEAPFSLRHLQATSRSVSGSCRLMVTPGGR
eukprot:7400044-Pyramimonas_sp.AAC.1